MHVLKRAPVDNCINVTVLAGYIKGWQYMALETRPDCGDVHVRVGFKTRATNQHSPVGIAESVNRLGYGLGDPGSIPYMGRDFCLPHPTDTGSASCGMGTRGSFLGCKAAGS
jgi:hypothetical protein